MRLMDYFFFFCFSVFTEQPSCHLLFFLFLFLQLYHVKP